MDLRNTAIWETAATVWTIRLALVCMAVALSVRFWKHPSQSIPVGDRWIGFAGVVWLIGSLFSLLHALAAMGFYHHWQHGLAYEDTARQTRELLGVDVGAGIYFNYCFVIVWIADALWWHFHPLSYCRRPRWLHLSVYGFLVFIAINGAIVFESGWTRWVGLLMVFGLGAIWYFFSASHRIAKD